MRNHRSAPTARFEVCLESAVRALHDATYRVLSQVLLSDRLTAAAEIYADLGFVAQQSNAPLGASRSGEMSRCGRDATTLTNGSRLDRGVMQSNI
jgi:hypothetical protein